MRRQLFLQDHYLCLCMCVDVRYCLFNTVFIFEGAEEQADTFLKCFIR